MKRMVQHYNAETFALFTYGRLNEINHIQTNINSKRKKNQHLYFSYLQGLKTAVKYWF